MVWARVVQVQVLDTNTVSMPSSSGRTVALIEPYGSGHHHWCSEAGPPDSGGMVVTHPPRRQPLPSPTAPMLLPDRYSYTCTVW